MVYVCPTSSGELVIDTPQRCLSCIHSLHTNSQLAQLSMSLETSYIFLLNISAAHRSSQQSMQTCVHHILVPQICTCSNLMYTLQERTAGWSLGSSALSFSSPVVYNTASSLYLAPVQQERNRAQQVNNLFGEQGLCLLLKTLIALCNTLCTAVLDTGLLGFAAPFLERGCTNRHTGQDR